MDTTASAGDTQPIDAQPIRMKGVASAQKKPPKLIEKVIDKLEEMLTQPADQAQPTDQTQPKHTEPQTQNSNEVNEVSLPKGTTITLPDGKAFVTQTISFIRRGKEVTNE